MFRTGEFDRLPFERVVIPETVDVAAEMECAEHTSAAVDVKNEITGGGLNVDRLKEILKQTGFPVAYDHFISDPAIPFILFRRAHAANVYADNRVYVRANKWEVILVTEKKSSAAERTLESTFDEWEICWEVADEFFVKEERIYQTIYEITELEV